MDKSMEWNSDAEEEDTGPVTNGIQEHSNTKGGKPGIPITLADQAETKNLAEKSDEKGVENED